MPSTEGTLTANDLQFALVVSTFNKAVTSRLEAGALATLTHHGASEDAIHIVRVPGAFEIPLVAGQLAQSKRYDAVICLGAIIRGQTPHFKYISAETSRGIGQVSLDTGIPVIFGVLTTNTGDEAMSRAGFRRHGTGANKGEEAARAAIEMATLMKALHASDRQATGFRQR